jgi:Concanavalin A-like lectin/glucanases superfamily
MAGNLTAMMASIFRGGVTADPFFEYTTLLLPGNGTNGAQNNTFLDGSTNNFTITRNGNTTQGTFSPFSQTGWGNYLPTTSERLTTASSSSDFSFGTGNFTVEGFVNLSSASNCMVFQMSTAATGYNPSNTNSVCFYIGGGVNAGKLEIYANNAAFASTNVLVTSSDIGKWYHFAIVRSSGSTTVYWNGSAVAGLTSIADSANYTMTYCVIGTVYNNTYSLQGYLSNFRVLKGTAQYSGASITVPTAPFATGTTNQVLLTCQANRFVDSNTATTAKTITVSGSPTVVAFSPFNPTASWSAATYGGSGYFDGNGDYLSVADNAALNLAGGSWTIDGWYYLTNGYSDYRILAAKRSDGVASYMLYTNPTTGYLSFWNGSTVYNSTTPIPQNQWCHIAYVYNGTNIIIYLNGTSILNQATTITNQAVNLYIGYANSGTVTEIFGGYIANFRIVKGTAITPPSGGPTSLSTAVSGTSLLLNFTNAGILDATSKNDLETVGNAQISTAQSKWGGSSMYFDGTGDWLQLPASDIYAFGSGDYTVEAWVNFTSINNTTLQIIFMSGSTGGNSFYFHVDGNQISVGTTAAFISNQATTFTTNSWYHIAACRSGTTLRLFVNGTQAGSNATDTTNWTSSGNARIGANEIGTQTVFGYIQDLRVTKGYARYTANFTPPTAAFPTL